MKIPNFNNWQVYYMDNDAQKIIVKSGLSYFAAVKLSQSLCTDGISAEYEPR